MCVKVKSEQIFWVKNNIFIQKHKIEYVSDKSRHEMAKKFRQESKFRKQIHFGALDYFAVVTSCFSRAKKVFVFLSKDFINWICKVCEHSQ